jgi:hypothetical protein
MVLSMLFAMRDGCSIDEITGKSYTDLYALTEVNLRPTGRLAP